MGTTTEKKVEAAVGIAKALEEAIYEAGPTGLPSGHLYAAVSGHLSLGIYQSLLDILHSTGRIRSNGWLLIHNHPEDFMDYSSLDPARR